MMTNQIAPSPHALAHLRPTDRQGLAVTTGVAATTILALWLSLDGGWLRWAAGQVLLGGALVQWFTVLHECGHRTLFRNRRLNALTGTIAGFLTMIPYRVWVRVHGRHHKWTGWRDIDPTMESVVSRQLSRFERTLINVCWRLWIPLFSTMYRVENYWKPGRLRTMFARPEDQRSMLRNAVLQLAAYGALVVILGPSVLARAAAAGILLSLIVEDLLFLSQHTHVPQNVSDGDHVDPVPAIGQEVFTRSLRLPAIVSSWLLHFDAHELHHMYPFVPGYHLRRIPYRTVNEVSWWEWVRVSKRLRGVTLLFESRRDTGVHI
jgi:omega-6 fatty acid desaturase (delta-12 desaturase)